MAVFEGALLLGLAPEDFVVAVRVERRVDVDQIHARGGQLPELFEIVAAIDDAGVDQAEGFVAICRIFYTNRRWSIIQVHFAHW